MSKLWEVLCEMLESRTVELDEEKLHRRLQRAVDVNLARWFEQEHARYKRAGTNGEALAILSAQNRNKTGVLVSV